MLRRVEGIVIKTQDYGETHKIITLFTDELGKITAIARGANKAKSRLSAITQPLIRGEFLIYLSKGLSTLQQGEVIDSFKGIRNDIIKTAYASYLNELSMLLIDDKVSESYLYQELIQTLKWIDLEDEAMIPVMMLEMKLFIKGGFAPIVDACVRCGTVSDLTSFSVNNGGLLCSSCFNTDPDAVQLNPNLIRLLQIFQTVKLEDVGTINVKQANIRLFRQLFDAYYEKYGSYNLKSKRFLEQINRLSYE